MPFNALFVQTMYEQADRMEAGALMLRKAAETIEFLSAELARSRLGAVTEQQQPIPQPLSAQTQQEMPAPRVSTPIVVPSTNPEPKPAEASVPAPLSRVDKIPTVPPSKPRSDLTADAMIRELRQRNGAIISGRRNGRPTDFEAECQAHELWCGTAKTLWGTLEPMDQRRVKAEREKLESTIAETKKKQARQRPQTHTVDPDTGEVLEAAE